MDAPKNESTTYEYSTDPETPSEENSNSQSKRNPDTLEYTRAVGESVPVDEQLSNRSKKNSTETPSVIESLAPPTVPLSEEEMDDEINLHSQTSEKLKQQLIEQDELLVSSRQDNDRLQDELTRLQRDSDSAKEEECQTDSLFCPACKTCAIPSIKVIYKDNLNYHESDDQKNEENGKVSTKENQKKAPETQINSWSCQKCKINFVLFKFENHDEQSKCSIELSLKDESKLSSSEQEQSKQKAVEPNTGLWGYIPRLKVKVCCISTGETFGAQKTIIEKVRKSFSVTVLEEVSSQDSFAIIVFCQITSRVGSDVESAMTNQQVSSLDKRVILVLMHHTRDPEYSTVGRKWSEVYKNIVLELHVLFHETIPGLLQCQKNDEAIETLQQTLYSFSKMST